MADKLILSCLNFALGWASLMRTRMRGVPAAYADVKRRHLDTAAVCEQHGVAFVPFPVLVPSTEFLHCSYPFMLRADIWSACTGYASVVFLLALPVAVLGVCRASLAFVHPSLTFDLQLILSVHHES